MPPRGLSIFGRPGAADDKAAARSGMTTSPASSLVFAGSANPALAAGVARELGVELGACAIDRFPDGEVAVRIEVSVRGRDVFVVQPTSPPVNDHLMELLAFADACRRADARRITALVPYFGYARSDKRQGARGPVTARAVADMMQAVGIGRVVTVDAHTPQIEGFFHIPIDDLSAAPPLCAALGARLTDDTVIVSPDLGGARRAADYGERLGTPTVVCVKRRMGGSSVAVTQVIGEVGGRRCIIVDDMITTGGTVAECARALRERGALEGMTVAASHGVFAPGALERMRAAGVGAVLVTDSIAMPAEPVPLVKRVGIASLLAAVVRHLADSDRSPVTGSRARGALPASPTPNHPPPD
jgi:ribose-phosphate pyrophosphokinase